ncbi:hypothetical protein Vi05172_g12868 [Venturia inaequalis]|nr:hypothetical protein Vi05172_g12868 [Venturia inaequalis]
MTNLTGMTNFAVLVLQVPLSPVTQGTVMVLSWYMKSLAKFFDTRI